MYIYIYKKLRAGLPEVVDRNTPAIARSVPVTSPPASSAV